MMCASTLRLNTRRLNTQRAQWALRGLLLLSSLMLGGVGSGSALAFDIPTPQNTPQSKADFFQGPRILGFTTPLPPLDSPAPNDTGAGQLPDGVTVSTTVHLPPEGALERAPILVTMTWLDRDKSVTHFRLHRPNGEHFDSRRIRLGQEIRVLDGRQVIAHTYQWALTPLAAGAITLDFARMSFQTVGAPDTRYEYQPASRILTVRPLPGYWPDTVPVSPPPRLIARPLPPLQAGQPADWQLRITGEGLTEYGLKHLLDEQLIGTAALGVGPAEVRLSPTDPVPADDALAQTFDVNIPLLPDPQGDGHTQASLPRLRLPYLDRHAAQPGEHLQFVELASDTLHWPPTARARLTDALQYWWWRGLLLLALLMTLGVGVFDLAQRAAARRRHRQAQQRLAACATPEALWRQLRQLTGCPHSAALLARAPNPWFSAAVHALDRACYAQKVSASSAAAIEPIRDELVRWLPTVFFRKNPAAKNPAAEK